jgi:fatty acid desaturase
MAYSKYKDQELQDYIRLNPGQIIMANLTVKKLRAWQKEHYIKDFLLQVVPFVLLGMAWLFSLLYLPQLLSEYIWIFVPLISLILGWIGYSFVVYTLHEGAGHGLFKTIPWLRRLCFHLSRLKMADPYYYKSCHSKHHNHLGTDKDLAFTNVISRKRFIRSVLPGAGILFLNDYNIHQNPQYTKSRVISELIGGLVIALEVYLLSIWINWTIALLIVCIFVPWIGMVLDRLRETIEHRLMPNDTRHGSLELGLSFIGMIIGGGPWGQPFHFSHHYAPDLNWYQQLALHLFFKKILKEKQKDFYFFNLKTFMKKNNQFRENYAYYL